MPISTITSKGQVTIPKAVRDRLHLRTGDKLHFRIEDDGTVRLLPIARKAADVFGVLAEKASRAYSAKETKQKLLRAFKTKKL